MPQPFPLTDPSLLPPASHLLAGRAVLLIQLRLGLAVGVSDLLPSGDSEVLRAGMTFRAYLVQASHRTEGRMGPREDEGTGLGS